MPATVVYDDPCCAGGGGFAAGGAAGAGAGGAGGALCMESDAASTAVNWMYVGENRGDYEKVDQYSFVGEGGGSFVREEVTTYYGCRVRPCFIGFLLILLIAVVVVIIWPRPVIVTATTTTTPFLITIPSTTFREISTTTSLPYDCDEDYHDCYHCLRVRWSYAKRHWCCAHVGRGCSTTTTEVSFDCDAGYNNWVAGWSDEKKEWCCARTRRGCPTTPCPHH